MTKGKQWGKTLACGCALGYERCMDCRPGLHADQETALAMTEREPSLDGYHAGLRGDDPRLCPHDKMTKEWREWQMWHGWGVDRRRAHEAFLTGE